VVGFSNPGVQKKGAYSRARRHPAVREHGLARQAVRHAKYPGFVDTVEPDEVTAPHPDLQNEYYGYPSELPVRGARNAPACRRCNGARQVALGRNMVSCPTCCKRVKNPLDRNEAEQLLSYAQIHTKLARTPTMSYDGRLESAATAYEDASIVKEFGKSSGLYGAATHAQTVARQARDEVKRSGPKRNPLASHKPGCRCIFHANQMGHNSIRKVGR
jgi:hypothetical protein